MKLKKYDFKDVETEAKIRKALTHLVVASTLIGESASGIKPFRISKILNMTMKTIETERLILYTILGDHSIEWVEDPTPIATPSFALLKTQIIEEKEEKQKQLIKLPEYLKNEILPLCRKCRYGSPTTTLLCLNFSYNTTFPDEPKCLSYLEDIEDGSG